MVTFHHFTSPRWLMRYGAWLDDKTPERFALYCERAAKHLGDLISAACTVNEPNLPVLLSKLLPFNILELPWWDVAAQAFRVAPDRLGLYQFVAKPQAREIILAAHRLRPGNLVITTVRLLSSMGSGTSSTTAPPRPAILTAAYASNQFASISMAASTR